MKVDTALLNSLADAFEALKEHPWLETDSLRVRQSEIQNGIDEISAFLRQAAKLCEESEQSIFSSSPMRVEAGSGLSVSGKASGNPSRLLSGATLRASGDLHYALGSAEGIIGDDSLYAAGVLNAGECALAGSASLRIFSGRKFNPSLKAQAAASASLLSAQITAGAGSELLGIEGEAIGQVGAVYADAEAVITADEITLSGHVGAAAARGECSAIFRILGAEVTLTAEGSLLSTEAGFDYHHSAREWEVGAKLGFIAGGGLKLKIEY